MVVMRRVRTTTLRDVARVAGVSVPTASQALNDRSGVRRETRDRVQDAARKLRYTPHAAARRLITGRSDSIGVVAGSNMTGIFSDRFYRAVLTGVGSVLEEAGFRMLITPAPRSSPEAPQFVRMARAQEVDGILALGIVSSRSLLEVTETGVPVVVIDDFSPELPVPTVLNDDAWGADAATRHLAALGHRRIGYVGPFDHEFWARETKAGYLRVLAELEMPADPVCEALVANTVDGGQQGAATLLSLWSPPTAILAGSGKIAIGVMKAARERGVEIPDALSVVAMGDSEFASITDPQLTTIHIRTEEMGQRGAQLLLASIQGQDAVAPVLIRPDLVIRGTSARPSSPVRPGTP